MIYRLFCCKIQEDFVVPKQEEMDSRNVYFQSFANATAASRKNVVQGKTKCTSSRVTVPYLRRKG